MDKPANSMDGSKYNDDMSPKSKLLPEEASIGDIDDKNYKKLVLHLNLHTANESNIQILFKKMDNEIQNVLKTSKKITQTTTSTVTCEKNDYIRSRDPRCRERYREQCTKSCRERFVSYLETVSIIGNDDQTPVVIEPSIQPLQQYIQLSRPPLEQYQQPSWQLLDQNKQASWHLLDQNKLSFSPPLEQCKQPIGPQLESNQHYGIPLMENKNPFSQFSGSTLNQNKQPYKSKSTLLENKQLSSSISHFDKEFEKNDHIQPCDPVHREKFMHYLEKISILGKNEQKSNVIEPSGKLLEQNKQPSGEYLEQSSQPSGKPLEDNKQFSGESLEQNKQPSGDCLEHYKPYDPLEQPLEQNKNNYEQPLEQNKNNYEQPLEQNKNNYEQPLEQNEQPLEQNEQPPRSFLYRNKQLSGQPLEQNNQPSGSSSNQNKQLSGAPLQQPLETNKKSTILPPIENLQLNVQGVVKKKTHLSEKVQDEKNEINQSTINKNSFSLGKKYEKTNLNNMKHHLKTFRENIISKYDQCFHRSPRNMTHNSPTPWDNTRPYYSWRNKTRLFNPKVNNSTDIRATVESMLNLVDNTSKTNLLTSPVDKTSNLKNTKTCFSLRQKNIEMKSKRKIELESQKNVDANHNLSNTLENKIAHFSEDSNNEALLNILSKIKFHSQTVHQNQETALSKLDEDQALQTFSPYQNPVKINQTKDILIILNEDRKKIITLNDSEGFSMLSEKLMNSLTKDLYYKDLLDNSSLLNYQMYNNKFNEWVDIDDEESFKLSDGVILKAVVGLVKKKRKKESKNEKKKKKEKLTLSNDVNSDHSQSESMLSDESVENKYQNTIKSLEKKRKKLSQELTNSDSKSQNITLNDESDYESTVETPTLDYFYDLKEFVESFRNKKNNNNDIESIVSKEKLVNSESNETLVKKNKRKNAFKLVIPLQQKEALIHHFEAKPRHPVQFLGDVAKCMNWKLPVYNLVQEGRNVDQSVSFLFSVSVNDTQVIAKETATTKKQARKLAAETVLKKLRLLKKS